MDIILEVLISAISLVVLGPLAIGLVVYALAQVQICFTFVKEGTAIFIVKGEDFDHVLMKWSGAYLNDPRRPWFDPDKPAWEIVHAAMLPPYALDAPWWSKNTHRGISSVFDPRSKVLRLLEYYGIYYYGLWPFRKVHEYKFEWTQIKIDEHGHEKPWHRSERTRIMYVNDYVYWIKLQGAENSENVVVDADYWLTTRVNNPWRARFGITNWLTRLTADSNNATKVWIGNNTFSQITKEVRKKRNPTTGRMEFVSGMVELVKTLNTNLPTDHDEIGAPERLGVTVLAASLQDIVPAGTNRDEIGRSMNAKFRADRDAEAEISKATGDARAMEIRADGEAKAMRIRGQGEADAAKTKLDTYSNYANSMELRRLEAQEKTGEQGNVVVLGNGNVTPMLPLPGPDRNRPPRQPRNT